MATHNDPLPTRNDPLPTSPSCIGMSTLVNSWIAIIPCKNERILSELSTKLICDNAEFKK